MAVKRDYGSFSKSCERYFTPMVAKLGISSLGGIKFGRKRDSWIDGLFLQQSQWGSGKFSVTVGFHVPGLETLWQTGPAFGLLLGGRLSEQGVGNDCWLPAESKSELLESLAIFAKYLEAAMLWFDSVQSLGDLAALYAEQNRLGPSFATLDFGHQLSAANYGFLLLLSGRKSDALPWLSAVEASMARPIYHTAGGTFVHTKQEGARLVKPSADDTKRLAAIRAAVAQCA